LISQLDIPVALKRVVLKALALVCSNAVAA
jgi:hypothetical protein